MKLQNENVTNTYTHTHTHRGHTQTARAKAGRQRGGLGLHTTTLARTKWRQRTNNSCCPGMPQFFSSTLYPATPLPPYASFYSFCTLLYTSPSPSSSLYTPLSPCISLYFPSPSQVRPSIMCCLHSSDFVDIFSSLL